MQLATMVFVVTTAFAVYIGFVRWIERRKVSTLRMASAPQELGLGVLMGAGVFTATIGILWAMGCYSATGIHDAASVMPAFKASVIGAVTEELLFRGIVFRIVEESLGSWAALVISALIFGAAHLLNPHATLWAGISIALQAGILLGLAYMQTRCLWLPIGMHFAWNFTQGGIFAGAVSGYAMQGLLQGKLSGADWVTGGNFGVEGSVFASLTCTTLALCFLWRAKQKRLFLAPASPSTSQP